jgi:hypothetical protein
VQGAWFYLTTYRPLVTSAAGRTACKEHGLDPFIDGSIRREPDLEHKQPAITCLCRAGKFAPRLRVGDVVGYMTTKGRFGTGKRHRRLTAFLRVVDITATHLAAAQWYRNRDMPLPNNVLVQGNPPMPLAQSHQVTRSYTAAGETATHRAWELSYQLRARKYRTVVICEVLFRDLTRNAPRVEDGNLIAVFGRMPGTQNPAAWPIDRFHELARGLGIEIGGKPNPRYGVDRNAVGPAP